MPKRSREGYAFFCVQTPSTFTECELPEDGARDSTAQAKCRADLAETAERYGAPIEKTYYRRG